MSKPQGDHNISIPPDLLEELLTDSEIRMVKQRLMILELLEQGNTVRSIAEQVGVGTDTVVRMARKMESNSVLREAFKKHNATQSASKWVFGKTDSEN
jgi:uncharacterized protein YerC